MNNEEIIFFLKTLDLSIYVHASNFIAKHKKWEKLSNPQKTAFLIIANKYYHFIQENNKLIGYTDEIIEARTALLNNYYDFINHNQYDNIFDSRSKFRSTILEEFMYILFKDLINEVKANIENSENNLKVGSKKAYTNLFFLGSNLNDFINAPKIGVHQKDQDFAIYRPIKITVENSKSVNTNLPIVSIENKTYIDKTMLEGSIATAEKIKLGNPYSLFFVVTERYAVDLSIDPAYSKIDQIYVLRKDNKKNTPNPIYFEVLIDLVSEVQKHLTKNWSDVSAKLTNTGKIL